MKSDEWACALWSHFVPAIARGGAFYLAADGRLIRELYVTRLACRRVDDAASSDFNNACLTLLDTSGTRAMVRRETFQRIQGERHSRVICLAVQQVLVVERMLNDVQYSEQAYFPRYREVLGLNERRLRSCPMETEAFQNVWRVLAGEIAAVPGAGPKAVTFSPGKGKDVNRRFPLSQALFTTHDLTIMREECPALDERASERVMLTALLRVREQLGVRARKLLGAAASDETIATRLCAQVRSFLGSDATSLLRPSPAVTPRAGTIVAYPERADAFDGDGGEDTFSLYVRSGVEQSAGALLEEAIARRLSTDPVVLLVPAEGDGFREWSRADPLVEPLNIVLGVVPASESHLFKERAARSYGATFVRAGSNLSARFELILCDTAAGSRMEELLGVPGPARRLELEGGLLADARSRVYLRGYPPSRIRYDGRALSGDESIVVGGVHRRVDEFLEALRVQPDGSRYTIQVAQAALSLSVSSRRHSVGERIHLGYALRDGELDIVARPVVTEWPNLRGTVFSDAQSHQTVCLGPGDIPTLTHRGKRLAISDAELALIVAELDLLGRSSRAARFAAQQIAITRSVPLKAGTSGLLQRLRTAQKDSAAIAAGRASNG